MSKGYRDVGKKKWCQQCGTFMAHEYRESGCPPVWCNNCYRSGRGCCLVLLLALAIAAIVAWVKA